MAPCMVATACEHARCGVWGSNVQSHVIWCCRQVLQALLDGLESRCRAGDSATAAVCAAGLVKLTRKIGDSQAGLTSSMAPEAFQDMLADASRQTCALCIDCACQQVQAINLRLATSDLFQPHPAAGGSLPPTAQSAWPAHHLHSAVQSCA